MDHIHAYTTGDPSNADADVDANADAKAPPLMRKHGFDNPSVNYTLLVVHSDDLDIVGQNKADIDYIATRLHDRFKITHGDPQFMLGLKRVVAKDGKSIEINQQAYVEGMVNDFSGYVAKKRTPSTPFPPGMYLSKQEPDKIDAKESKRVHKELKFLSLVGQLLWASRMTFIECAIGCHYLTRQLANPTVEAFEAGIHMLAYMNANKTKGIKFSKVKDPTLVTYYDASNRGDTQDKMKAVGGHVVLMCNGPLLWSSKKLGHVGQSSSHNEYMQLAEATKATVWLRELLKEMQLSSWVIEPTMMMGDNDAATSLCRTDLVTPANRYYDKFLFFSKEAFENHSIDPARVDTKDNYADGLTKAVPRQVIEAHIQALKGYERQQALPDRPLR